MLLYGSTILALGLFITLVIACNFDNEYNLRNINTLAPFLIGLLLCAVGLCLSLVALFK